MTVHFCSQLERERLTLEMAEKERYAKQVANQERKALEEKSKRKSRRSSYDPRYGFTSNIKNNNFWS